MEHPAERLLFVGLSLVLALLVCAYLYFVTASIMNVIARKDALSQIDQLQGQMGSAEQQYFALSQQMTPSEGASLGLVPVQNTQYVYRPGVAASAAAVKAGTIASNAI